MRLQKRLAPRDANAVEDAFSFGKVGKKLVLHFVCCRGIFYDARIVTKGTAQIASSRENGTGNLAGIIKKRKLLIAFYADVKLFVFHFAHLPISELPCKYTIHFGISQ